MLHVTADEPIDPYLREATDTDTVVDVLLPTGRRVYVVPESQLESLMETVEAVHDPETVSAIRAGLADVEDGDLVSLEEARRMVAGRAE